LDYDLLDFFSSVAHAFSPQRRCRQLIKSVFETGNLVNIVFNSVLTLNPNALGSEPFAFGCIRTGVVSVIRGL